jgi:prepilin-type N-terminal cleavage/methylation domain-containing protein
MNKKGFTLIELMIVIAIIGILAAIAIPNFTKVRERAAERAAGATLSSLVQAMESYASMDFPGDYPRTLVMLRDTTRTYFDWRDLSGNLTQIGFTGDGDGGYTLVGKVNGVRGDVYAVISDIGKTANIVTAAPANIDMTDL